MTRNTLLLLLCMLVGACALSGCGRAERRAERAAMSKKQSKNSTGKGVQEPARDAKAKEQAKPVPANSQSLWSVSITEFGNDEKEALTQAASKARAQLATFLTSHKPPIAWIPSAEYIEKKLTDTVERNHEKEADLAKALAKEGKRFDYQCWDVTFSVSAARRADILNENHKYLARERQKQRDERREERMVQESKVVAVILALLLGMIGYIRLDHWTRGYCTRVLKVMLMGTLVAAGAGLWWFL